MKVELTCLNEFHENVHIVTLRRMVFPRILVVVRCCSNANAAGQIEDPTDINETAVERSEPQTVRQQEDVAKERLKQLASQL